MVIPLLVGGEWRYRERGILDKTHLRFFTRKSMLSLFRDCGYVVESLTPVRITPPSRGETALLFAALGKWGIEFRAKHYITVASHNDNETP